METSASAVMGISGGLAMLGTVPGDVLQYYLSMFAGLHFSGIS